MGYTVTAQGHPGTYFDQPEATELEADCPIHGEGSEMYTFETPYGPDYTFGAVCVMGDEEHEVTLGGDA